MIRVLLAVNDPRLADQLSGLFAEADELQVVTTLRDPQELRGALPRHDVDAIVLHDRRGSVPLIEVTRELTVAHPDVGLVLVVSEDSPELLRSGMQAGARDVIAEPAKSLALLAKWIQKDWCKNLVFHLKFKGRRDYAAAQDAAALLAHSRFARRRVKHLFYDKNEVTVLAGMPLAPRVS